MAIRRRKRRGIVLLICLSILVLFMLIGVTFLIVSGQYLSGAKIMARHNRVGDDPQRETEMAFMQAVAEPRAFMRSALRGHSLLRDLYGTDGLLGRVTVQTVDVATGRQFVQISFTPSTPIPNNAQRSGYFNGRVFTMLNGPAAGISTRIVDYGYNTGTGVATVLVEMFEGDNANLVNQINANTGLVGYRCLINGAAFNGTGYGYDSSTGNLDLTYPPVPGGLPMALLPNFQAYLPDPNYPSTTNLRLPELGGADESYDAADYQNMFLAKNVVSPPDIEPSFHRRALVRYWNNYYTNTLMTPLTPDVIRRFVLRPMPFDHPNFTGSNSDPRFASSGTLPDLLTALVSGPWDVDNDGDGVRDSIWLDLDLPLKTMPDGRRYKPLVAFLIQDLDGRLNLNAHGSLAHLEGTYTNQVFGAWASGTPFQSPRNARLTRGLGYGPADIAFGHIMSSGADFQNVLYGRHGADGGTPRAGVANTNDGLSALKTSEIPPFYNSAVVSAFASPPDVWGRGAMGFDYAGQPLFVFQNIDATAPYLFGPPAHNSVTDDPYELNLSQTGSQDTGAWDAPYTVGEMERLLRMFDADGPTLPSRLAALAPTTFGLPLTRTLVTTQGSQIPVPNVTLPAADRSLTAPHFSDLFAGRLASGMGLGVSDPMVTAQLRAMLPFEMYRGQLFNVNRPLGNGRDDAPTNGIVDEPRERDTGEFIWATGNVPAQFNNIPFNYLNNDPFITVNRFAPQIYARHLYCLMMFLNDQNFSLPFLEGTLTGPQSRELTAQRIAQWAINVVDFRDPDAIMTPFEYDINPFDGWQPMDGNPGTDELILGSNPQRRIVWGAEFPDLMITETKSFHDRRVRDTNYDNRAPPRRVGGMMNDDDDVDQFRIPQGSLFIELYCPRNYYSNNQLLPRELYGPDIVGNPIRNRLNLANLAPIPSSDGVRHPVWRLAISANHTELDGRSAFRRATPGNPSSTSFDPDDMSLLIGDTTSLPIERYVWFTNQNPAGSVIANRVFRNSLGWNASVAPGQYAVVGPRATTIFGSITDGDDTTTPYDGPARQRIVLQNWTANPTGVVVRNVADTITTPAVGSQIQPAVGIIADMDKPAGWMNATHPRIGLNVTEPMPLVPSTGPYYPEPNPMDDGRIPSDAYDNPDAPMNMLPDEPYDSEDLPIDRPLRAHGMLATATYENRNTVFVQRLANPLEAWHPLANPYISIDWAAIDTTVFTGEENTNRQGGGVDLDPNDRPAARELYVRTRERGEQRPVGTPTGNIWSPYAPLPPRPTGRSTAAGGTPTPYFDFNLTNTFSYLNVAASTAGRLTMPPLPAIASGYVGAPANPFPHLNWLDRPFASPLELMQVPASTPGRLLWEYSTATDDAPANNPYDPNGANAVASNAPFGHLLNFTQGSRPTQASFTAMTAPVPGQFHRLFDLVETPSPFVGTERWYNPTLFSQSPPVAGGSPVGSSSDGLRPPYNRLSRFRQPGQVNLNTIFDYQVFQGLMMGYGPPNDVTTDGATYFWTRFLNSREGFEGTAAANFPTEYSNPFRAANSSDLAPPSPFVQRTRRDGVEATILRSVPDGATGTYMPLFGYKPQTPPAPPPLGEVAHANSRLSSSTRYHPLQRLPNLVSTHSNVYAIWITVGFFEVEARTGATAVDANHPDGYNLGQEIGLDTGTVKRHRAFYIFDRSIPVAFEPGENHNVDRAVLLKRFIE